MNPEENYEIRLAEILERDPRYPAVAYEFVRAGVSFTAENLNSDEGNPVRRHISGQELLEGLRELALQQFGPLALNVLHEWGIRETLDFGCIVFNLVGAELLGANENDSLDDFRDGYDFHAAFVEPFLTPDPLPDTVPLII